MPARKKANKKEEDESEQHGKWQSLKSSLTADRIVIATLECIVEFGYEHTTMAKISQRAKVTSGALQYHFGSKIEAIKAAINYLHEKRLADRRRDQDSVPDGVNPIVYVMELYWQHLNEAHFIAYQELVLAARTHPELASVLKPAYQDFLANWRDDAVNHVPEWSKDREQFELIADISQYILEGLAYGRLNDQIDDVRTRKVLDFTGDLLIEMLTEIQETKA